LKELFEKGKFSAIFHMAANSDIGKSFAHSKIDFRSTFETTYEILEMMRRYDVDELVFPSSSAIYGETSKKLEVDPKRWTTSSRSFD